MSAPVSVLSVAGSDPSGGAGIQADMKVAALLGVHGAAVPSLLTVQDSSAVHQSVPIEAELFRAMLDAVLEDLDLSAVKIGAISGVESARVLAECLCELRVPIVFDPILKSSSGREFLGEEALRLLEGALFPRLALLTPNLVEARALYARGDAGDETLSAERVGRGLYERYGVPILVKGGHAEGDPVDLLFDAEGEARFVGERIEGDSPHGTGCALSMAVASGLAQGRSLREAIGAAKAFVRDAIEHAFRPGSGAPFLRLHR